MKLKKIWNGFCWMVWAFVHPRRAARQVNLAFVASSLETALISLQQFGEIKKYLSDQCTIGGISILARGAFRRLMACAGGDINEHLMSQTRHFLSIKSDRELVQLLEESDFLSRLAEAVNQAARAAV